MGSRPCKSKCRPKTHRKKKHKGLLWLIIAVLVCICLYLGLRPKPETGSKSYELDVVYEDGSPDSYTGKTDAEYLSDLMDELQEKKDFSYEGTESSYGLYIETVNNVTADFQKDGAYWAIYVNGDYGQYGADSQPAADGEKFVLQYEK